ncbi:hypothetical protein ACQVSN_07085 [Bacillus mobilis]|uniref:hypothetical protein n=1 Tax=Bacillus mobilis TaxID=2026190 RepID=UPI0021D340B4|nr:hypothetical protein [Bacillus mobilis]MCU5193463.1 hypothetical protein [Bacillus mobilis]
MVIKTGTLDLNELSRIELHGIPFGYKYDINTQSNNKELIILPNPGEIEDFNKGRNVFSYETLTLLRSKYFFAINHRCQLLEVLYTTFRELFNQEKKDVNDFLTLQALYSDMIIRIGTILEDFAGMCYSCKEYLNKGDDIAQSFLAYSDPISFYESIVSKKGKRKIKQIFLLPESKRDLNQIFKDLSEQEINLLWKAVQQSTDIIADGFKRIGSSIIRKSTDSMTLYDMYNKLKHGFSPIYPFITPMPIVADAISNDESVEDVISKYFFENLTIMHDKLPGQRSPEEQERYTKEGLATAAFTYQDINLETAKDITELAQDISSIYHHLIKKYLLLAIGNKQMIFFSKDGNLNEEELERIYSISNDKERYNN